MIAVTNVPAKTALKRLVVILANRAFKGIQPLVFWLWRPSKGGIHESKGGANA